MNDIHDDKLYSLGLEHYKKNKLDKSYDCLIKIQKKNLNTYKLISNIHIKKNVFIIFKYKIIFIVNDI